MNFEEISKAYGITEEELIKTKNNIIKTMLYGKTPEENPVTIFDIGPSGSGKTGLNGYAVNQFTNNNIIVINNDELKPFYPNADEISKKYPEHYIKVTNEASKVWTDALIDEAIEGKYNVLYEGTGRKIKIFERMISAMKKKGYKIVVRAMAVNELNCLMSIVERYEYQVQKKGWGRLVSLETFYKAYSDEMLDTIEKLEKSDDISLVEVYMRGEAPEKPVKIYSGNKKEFPSAREAVIAGRKKDRKLANEYYKEYFCKEHNTDDGMLEESKIMKHINTLYCACEDREEEER